MFKDLKFFFCFVDKNIELKELCIIVIFLLGIFRFLIVLCFKNLEGIVYLIKFLVLVFLSIVLYLVLIKGLLFILELCNDVNVGILRLSFLFICIYVFILFFV